MRVFAWVTFLTGLALSGIAAFFSVIGLALVYSGAYWPVVALASMLEVSKLVAVSWLYRYRHLAGRAVRGYLYAATIALMLITSLGIFGFLTRAHVETEGVVVTAQLTRDAALARETQLQQQRTSLQQELTAIGQQSSRLVEQLGTANRLRGTTGAVAVQRETTSRRASLLAEVQRIDEAILVAQQERIQIETDANAATADIGPLRYVARVLYGIDDMSTIRSAVAWLTVLVMIVFDPMAIMLLIAANILFTHTTPPPTIAPLASSYEPEIRVPNVTPPTVEDVNRVTDLPPSLR